MGSLKAERNSTSTIEATALALIKRNINQCVTYMYDYIPFLSENIFILKFLNKISIFFPKDIYTSLEFLIIN